MFSLQDRWFRQSGWFGWRGFQNSCRSTGQILFLIFFIAKVVGRQKNLPSTDSTYSYVESSQAHLLMLFTMLTLPFRTTDRTASVAWSIKPPPHHTIAQHLPNKSSCQSYEDLAVQCHKSTFHVSRRGRRHVVGPLSTSFSSPTGKRTKPTHP